MTPDRGEPTTHDAAAERISRARHEGLRELAAARNKIVALRLLRRHAPDRVEDALRELRAAVDELAAEVRG